MIETERMERMEFYNKCAELLECSNYVGEPFEFRKRTRWNNRKAGQGRFPGHGVIRRFSDNLIMVLLRDPNISCLCHSEEEVFEKLIAAMA